MRIYLLLFYQKSGEGKVNPYEVPFTLVLPAFTEVSSGKVKGEGKNGSATFPFTSAF